MFKYETHMHTSEGSACASSTACEMIDKYRELGYTGVMITDHFFNGNSSVDRSLSWEKQVDWLCRGYENGKEYGDKIGFDVFFGFEFSSNGSDYLTYGLSKEWLKAHPEVMSLSLSKYIDFVHENGGFVVHAHPFRLLWYVEMIKLLPDRVDAVEVINASHTDKDFDKRALWYAESYGLPKVSGSDSHSTDRVFGGGISVEKRFTDISDYLTVIKNSEIKALHTRMPEFD